MREQEYIVKLNKKERVRLEGLPRKGKTAAQLQTRARILLHADRGRARRSWSNERIDYAHMLKEVADKQFPKAKKIVLVQDNLNTHKPASLYEAFPPEEDRRLVERFEWHYTPKHGSWLDMAESELGVLSKQCLDRRIPDTTALAKEVAAWVRYPNRHHVKANWHFTTDDARFKLKRLYLTF